jgi:hypothetical protein
VISFFLYLYFHRQEEVVLPRIYGSYYGVPPPSSHPTPPRTSLALDSNSLPIRTAPLQPYFTHPPTGTQPHTHSTAIPTLDPRLTISPANSQVGTGRYTYLYHSAAPHRETGLWSSVSGTCLRPEVDGRSKFRWPAWLGGKPEEKEQK